MSRPVVHVVHCIDTEGPLYEPLEVTFQRLRSIFGLELEPSTALLEKLRRRQVDLGAITEEVARVVSPELCSYNDTWDKIDHMLDDMLSPAFRNRAVDSFGGGWVYNWFCLDHVGFTSNPRRRDMGFHAVFDHYRQMVRESGSHRDGIHFHHHPVNVSREAHRCATHFFAHTPMVYEILARDIIDRRWFPCVFRPGFHTIRPDSAWLVEQFFPFDFSSQSTDEDYSRQRDLADGRFGDWRRAPRSWAPYHPHHDDWQVPGNCRRWTARCLNVGTRMRLLREEDVELAFREAEEGKPVVLAFTNHDFRDMRPDVEGVRAMLAAVAARHPGVDHRYCEARDAMRSALGLAERPALKLDVVLESNCLKVRADGPTFGPQPFLALKTHGRQFLHDNLDFQEPFREWSYVFDDDSVPLAAVQSVGLGVCDATGNVTVSVLDVASGRVETTHH